MNVGVSASFSASDLSFRTFSRENLFLSVSSSFSRHEGRRSSSSALVGESGFGLVGEVGEAALVAVVEVTVVVAVVVEDDSSLESGLDEVVCCCCCCLFFMSCSAVLMSSSVTPWVERRVERTILAWAFLCVSLSSSRLGGMNDLPLERVVGEVLVVRTVLLAAAGPMLSM